MALLQRAVAKQRVNVRPCILEQILHAAHLAAQLHCATLTRVAAILLQLVLLPLVLLRQYRH